MYAAALALVNLAIVGFIQPYSRYAYEGLSYELRSGAPDHVRARSAVALGAIRAPAAVAPLIDLAADRVSADDARAVAVAALGLVVDPSRPRSLLRLSADANGLALTDALAEVLSLL
jgi:HEAT repeat protein